MILKQVDNLRRQAEEQETSLKSQEEELSSKKQELEGLKQEEARLEHQQEDFRKKLDNLSQNLQDSQLQISQVRKVQPQMIIIQRFHSRFTHFYVHHSTIPQKIVLRTNIGLNVINPFKMDIWKIHTSFFDLRE